MDKLEVNFRLMLLSQRESNLKLASVATQMGQIAAALVVVAEQTAAVASQVSEVASQVTEVALKGEETANRLDDSIGIMKSFADGQAEIRATLADCVRRLDVLEGKKAS